MNSKNLVRPILSIGAISLLLASQLQAQEIVADDLLTSSNLTTPWQTCGDDAAGIDVTTLAEGGCAYRTTPAEPGITYTMSCGVKAFKFASITLAFLDADDNTLASESTEIHEHVTGAYSVSYQSPAGTATAAIGIYGETGSGFQDCVLVDATPPPEPTKGSIAGVSWFDENGDSILDSTEDLVPGTQVVLYFNGSVLDQTSTGLDGSYQFAGLDVDECYTVTFQAADATVQLGNSGGDNDAVNNGSTANICLTDVAADVRDIDAAFVAVPPVEPPADYAICGVTWLDTNSNGIYDGDDSALANVQVRLIDTAFGTISTLRSNDNGAYAFNKMTAGDYIVRFFTPDGHEITTPSAQIAEGTSYVGANGRTPVISIPEASNTTADSACTVINVNGGFTELPTVIEPTVANNDEVEALVGTNVSISILANDAPCTGQVNEVNLLGHNVPGNVTYDAATGALSISDTTEEGTFSIEYGLRGECGSYDTANVTVILNAPEPPVVPNAPAAPVCRIETGGSVTYGGVDVFAATVEDFAPQYNMYDRDGNLVVSVFTDNYTHLFLQANPSQWSIDFKDMYEIEWNGSNFGFDQVSIHFVSAVDAGLESERTQCIRHNVSPIALDLSNKGRIQRVAGEYSVDLNSDGFAEALTEWFAPDAGILVIGTPSGQISGDHLFGNVQGVFEDGFEELAELDKNSDRVIAEQELQGLSIWTDLNSNTQVDAGELSTLADHGIVSLPVDHYKFLARAQKADGRTILMEDVWLPLAPMALLAK